MIVGLSIGLFLLLAILTAGSGRFTRAPLMGQWGRFVATRPGLRGSEQWEDEPELVEYENFKWWIRIKPNPGINLPLIGYWSKASGRKRRS